MSEFDVIETLSTRFLSNISVHVIWTKLTESESIVQGLWTGLNAEGLFGVTDAVPNSSQRKSSWISNEVW